jgi:hypothetical protein
MKNCLISVLIYLCIFNSVFAAETCSRVATINFQEVLVDTSNTNKGEGLRYYLEKDPIAVNLLNEYQEKNKPGKLSVVLSTIGSSMIMAGLLGFNTGRNEAIFQRDNLVIGGLLVIGLNYLTTLTVQYNNEAILEKSIEQYNKRNTPTIYFSPFGSNPNESGAGIGIQQRF